MERFDISVKGRSVTNRCFCVCIRAVVAGSLGVFGTTATG